ncbi:polysaccharide lyase [Mycolicibacterium fluoranthenivorans]|uniref:Polysaccharide lyase n=1 Tax=Mycolicibacterium fluoranthenivorans TaxID=258505 RepID=A0A7X5U3W9_9MYCO|nr:polysaccharide lyase [Mycolicibacterium fluoranthenivorans]MCV7356207.1 heparin lyase I family protein [Mycolicibacterium fluoranthenivorans]NIH97875.1 hypothetical protein [Mycolicibacterium fluoranthenivorans]
MRLFVSSVVLGLALWSAPDALAAGPLFTGDYATGDFAQWPTVQVRGYNGPGKDYIPGYSARIVDDPTKGRVARFEVRPGDVPPFGGGERAEVQGDTPDAGGSEGQTRWYRFSTKFDQTFPMNHGDLGWGVTNQWHQDGGAGSPPISWTVDSRNGFWSLTIEDQSAPGVWLGTFSIFDTPLDVGQWHDVTMQINWSASDDKGWIRLWHNGIRETFVNGADTYFVRTLIPGDAAVYYKEGMYRKPTTSTDIVYHTGFRAADSADGL